MRRSSKAAGHRQPGEQPKRHKSPRPSRIPGIIRQPGARRLRVGQVCGRHRAHALRVTDFKGRSNPSTIGCAPAQPATVAWLDLSKLHRERAAVRAGQQHRNSPAASGG